MILQWLVGLLWQECDVSVATLPFTVSAANEFSQTLKDAVQETECFIMCDCSITGNCDVERKIAVKNCMVGI